MSTSLRPLAAARVGRVQRRSGLVLACLAALAVASPALARERAGSRQEAIALCARELSHRFGGDVSVEQVRRVTRRDDRLSVEARMRVRRPGPDVVREVDCAVRFRGRPRVVAFSTSRDLVSGGGWGWSGDDGDERAARRCYREALSVGYPVRKLLGVRALQGGGRLVTLRSGQNDQVDCLYRNGGVRDLRLRRR